MTLSVHHSNTVYLVVRTPIKRQFKSISLQFLKSILNTPFTQIPPTRVCFTNAGVNSNSVRMHKVRTPAI